MTNEEIVERIAQGEDSRTQFKLGPIGVAKLAAELAAFSNAGGGVILFGVGIISPGSLPNHLTIDKIKAGVSVARNPVLFTFATKEIPYRGLGSGVKRILEIVKDIEFKSDDELNLFTVIVKRNKGHETVNGTREVVTNDSEVVNEVVNEGREVVKRRDEVVNEVVNPSDETVNETVKSGDETVNCEIGGVKDRAGGVNGGNGPVNGPVNKGRGPVNVPINDGHVPVNGGNVPVNGGNVPVNGGDVPVNVPVNGGDVPINVPINGLNVSVKGRNETINDKNEVVNGEHRAVSQTDEVVKEVSEVVKEVSEVVIEVVRRNPGIRKPHLMPLVCKSRATVERALANLMAKSMIEFRGAPKNGGYYVIESTEREESR